MGGRGKGVSRAPRPLVLHMPLYGSRPSSILKVRRILGVECGVFYPCHSSSTFRAGCPQKEHRLIWLGGRGGRRVPRVDRNLPTILRWPLCVTPSPQHGECTREAASLWPPWVPSPVPPGPGLSHGPQCPSPLIPHQASCSLRDLPGG